MMAILPLIVPAGSYTQCSFEDNRVMLYYDWNASRSSGL